MTIKTVPLEDIPLNKRGDKILKLKKQEQINVLNGYSAKVILEIIDFLDPVQTNKLLSLLSKAKKSKIAKQLTNNVQHKLKVLTKLQNKDIGSYVDFNYIQVDENARVKEVSKIIASHEKLTSHTPIILITTDGYLSGEVPFKKLIHAKGSTRLKKLIKKLPKVNIGESEDKLIKVLKKNPNGKVVILNDNKSILGITYCSDIIHLIDKERSKSLNKFAGIDDEESISDDILTKVEHRYKWLIINLFTAFMAAAIVGIFESTISKTAVLAAYLPIVAGMGGNAATQTFAVTVRGLALNQIDVKNIKRIIKDESLAGIVNGLITGAIATIVAMALGQTPMLGIILALAMIFNLFIAGFFGVTIPVLMNKLGKDPATSATILITTATDVFGFLAFLTLAVWIIH